MTLSHASGKGFGILLGRGLLGGALGGLVMIVTLINPVTVGKSWYFWVLVGYPILGLPCGLLIGGITGIAIWLIHRQTAARLGPFVRAVVGALIAIVFWGLFFRLRDPSDYAGTSWQWYLIAVLIFGATTGLVTGLIVGSQTRTNSSSEVQQTKGQIVDNESLT